MLITPLLLQATAQGHGACLLDGKLIEQLHAENAQRIIQLHENIQAFEEAAGIALG
jgi:citrate lyase beta subunit